MSMNEYAKSVNEHAKKEILRIKSGDELTEYIGIHQAAIASGLKMCGISKKKRIDILWGMYKCMVEIIEAEDE